MFFNENKRKRVDNNRIQFPEDWVGTSTWPPFLLFGDTNMAAVTSYENQELFEKFLSLFN